jgi:predicted nucleotide-binding protein/fido (protein-threonine AMPylation protein)
LSPAEVVRLESENGLKQADRMFAMIEHAIESGKFRLRPSTLIELDRIAVNGLVNNPGTFRNDPIEIEHSGHTPPPHEDVPSYIDELCEYVTEEWASSSAIHLAAYILWRLNWIHPFEDGNGRTSRAACYLVLCVRLGYKLPGTRTIPEYIAADKNPYYLALESADGAWRKGTLDLGAMEALIKECLAAQLIGVVEQASGGPVEGGTAAAPADPAPPTRESTSLKQQPPAATTEKFNRKPRLFIGSSTEGLPIAEALQVGLEYDAEVTVWSQGVFGLSTLTLEALIEQAKDSDFAVLVLTADDMLIKRGESKPVARDNVLFELGLFIGIAGRYRTFVVHPRGHDMHMPTDLSGLAVATYDPNRSDSNLLAAVGAACTQIKHAVRDQGRLR